MKYTAYLIIFSTLNFHYGRITDILLERKLEDTVDDADVVNISIISGPTV